MKVVISGFFGFGNTGDEAILKSTIENLRKRKPNIDITVFSYSPEDTARSYQVKSIYRGWRRQTLKKIRALKQADVLISGGGGLLQDAYSTQIISGPIPYYLLVVLLAKTCGTKVMFFSQGIGPITSRYGKLLVKRIANKADLITVRDTESKQLLETLGVTKPEIIVTADIVFALPVKNTHQKQVEKIAPINKGPYIAVSVRPWFDQEDYLKRIAETLDKLVQSHKLKPIFIPMEGVHDYNAALKVAGQMNNNAQCILVEPGLASDTIMQIIQQCQMTMGMRLHSLIFSVLAGIPYIGVVYDPKVENLMRLTGMSEYAVPMNDIDPEQMVRLTDKLLKNRESLIEHISGKRDHLQKQALKNIELLEQYFLNEGVGEGREHPAYDHF